MSKLTKEQKARLAEWERQRQERATFYGNVNQAEAIRRVKKFKGEICVCVLLNATEDVYLRVRKADFMDVFEFAHFVKGKMHLHEDPQDNCIYISKEKL
jgi:hypothetical protein